MTVFHLNIGSNVGGRHAFLGLAVAAVCRMKGVRNIRITAPFESEPWGYDSACRFVNIGLTGTTSLTPFELHRRLTEIQNRISALPHRNTDGGYADRELDIDLICFGSVVVDTPVLQLPHPLMHLRDFVLRPMAEHLPRWRHPIFGLTTEQLHNQLLSLSHNS